MPLAIPPYVPRVDCPELEQLRAQLATAEKTIAAQRADILALIKNGNVVCDCLNRYVERIRDYKSLPLITEMRAGFDSYHPKS